jgi:UDP-3-O-[3-hydroxymyristoyl] glucosamine N-acyltransferase
MLLRDVAERLGCELRGDGGVEILRVAAIDHAGPGDLTFVANPRYATHLARTQAAAVIVSKGVATLLPSLLSTNPYLTYARAVALLHPEERSEPGVHPSAQVDPSAVLDQGVHVGALVVIGARARIGRGSVLHPLVGIAEEATLGEDCVLHSGVQVRERCRLGNRVIVQNGAVIGADGFGFAKDEHGRYHKIPQRGIVVIEDDVEIGALTAIDRAALAETRIARGAKLDNLVQIGHSVTIGEDTVLAGQVGVAGHLDVGDGVIATAQTGIPASIEAGRVVSGYPALDNRAWLKSSAVFGRLPELQKRVRELEREIEELKKRLGPA